VIANIICEILQRLFVGAFPWYAYFLYGLEITVAGLIAVVALGHGDPLFSFVFAVYAAFNVWQLRSTLSNYYARARIISSRQPRPNPVEPPKKSFDQLAAELSTEAAVLDERVSQSGAER
jgi:hypothetical protein